ncbi:MAG: hypothetical protein ACR2P4_09235 [Gammaproteobacteria bacterium]
MKNTMKHKLVIAAICLAMTGGANAFFFGWGDNDEASDRTTPQSRSDRTTPQEGPPIDDEDFTGGEQLYSDDSDAAQEGPSGQYDRCIAADLSPSKFANCLGLRAEGVGDGTVSEEQLRMINKYNDMHGECLIYTPTCTGEEDTKSAQKSGQYDHCLEEAADMAPADFTNCIGLKPEGASKEQQRMIGVFNDLHGACSIPKYTPECTLKQESNKTDAEAQ